MGEKWHMVPLVHENNSGTEVTIWVGRWLEVIVGEDKRIEGWVFQRDKEKMMGVQDLDVEFQEGLRISKERKAGLRQA